MLPSNTCIVSNLCKWVEMTHVSYVWMHHSCGVHKCMRRNSHFSEFRKVWLLWHQALRSEEVSCLMKGFHALKKGDDVMTYAITLTNHLKNLCNAQHLHSVYANTTATLWLLYLLHRVGGISTSSLHIPPTLQECTHLYECFSWGRYTPPQLYLWLQEIHDKHIRHVHIRAHSTCTYLWPP